MPKITPDEVKRRASDGKNDPCGAYETLLFSDTGGLTQFGARVEILPPGSSSALKHWHSAEDEMVYMLEGEALLHEGDESTVLRKGDAATFRAGDPVGHRIENASDRDLSYLVIGTRSATDTVTYPDNDRILYISHEDGTSRWTDHAGNPADSAYSTN